MFMTFFTLYSDNFVFKTNGRHQIWIQVIKLDPDPAQ